MVVIAAYMPLKAKINDSDSVSGMQETFLSRTSL
jgi:hypothetical protein